MLFGTALQLFKNSKYKYTYICVESSMPTCARNISLYSAKLKIFPHMCILWTLESFLQFLSTLLSAIFQHKYLTLSLPLSCKNHRKYWWFWKRKHFRESCFFFFVQCAFTCSLWSMLAPAARSSLQISV